MCTWISLFTYLLLAPRVLAQELQYAELADGQRLE